MLIYLAFADPIIYMFCVSIMSNDVSSIMCNSVNIRKTPDIACFFFYCLFFSSGKPLVSFGLVGNPFPFEIKYVLNQKHPMLQQIQDNINLILI